MKKLRAFIYYFHWDHFFDNVCVLHHKYLNIRDKILISISIFLIFAFEFYLTYSAIFEANTFWMYTILSIMAPVFALILLFFISWFRKGKYKIINLSHKLTETPNLEASSNSTNDNIFDNEIIAILSKIIKKYRMPGNKGKKVFGIPNFSKPRQTKTQLTILLSIIKEDDLFNGKYRTISDRKFLNDFFNKIEIEEKITIQYFWQIKMQVMSKDEESGYEDVVIKFKDILSKELSNII